MGALFAAVACVVGLAGAWIYLLDFRPLHASIALRTEMSGSRASRRRMCGLPATDTEASALVPARLPRVALVLVYGGEWGAWAGPLAEYNVRAYASKHGYDVVR
jgi:hypothetical protein